MDGKEITDALSNVKDSYFNKDLITLGYIKGMSIGDKELRFTLRLPAPLMPNHEELAQKCRDALKDVNEIWGSEVGLYFPKIYAGTTDCVGQYKGNPCIIDFKQTNKPKKKEWVEDYFLQLVAYAEAHNEVYGTDIKEGHVFMCSRKLDYQQFDITPTTYNHYKKEWWNRVEEYYIKHAV